MMMSLLWTSSEILKGYKLVIGIARPRRFVELTDIVTTLIGNYSELKFH